MVVVLERIDRVAGAVGQRRDFNELQLLQLGVAVDIEVVGEEAIDADAQNLILDRIDQRVVDGRRCVVDGSEIDLDTGRDSRPN